jgi:hypothetical protein
LIVLALEAFAAGLAVAELLLIGHHLVPKVLAPESLRDGVLFPTHIFSFLLV